MQDAGALDHQRVREIVLELSSNNAPSERRTDLEALAGELDAPGQPPYAELEQDRFWLRLLLAFDAPDGPAASDAALARLRATAAERADLVGAYWCLSIAAEHLGARQLDAAERFASFGLQRFPPAPEITQELWRLDARVALETGRITEARARLGELKRSLATLEGLPASERARLAAMAEGEWAGLWMSLGVMDRAAEHLARAEELARDARGPVPELFLRRADFLLLIEEYARLVEEIGRWRASTAPLEPRLAALLDLYEGVARSELEREARTPAEPRAEALLTGLLARPDAALVDQERARAWIDVADLRLRAGDPGSAEQALGCAREALRVAGEAGAEDQSALLTVVDARVALARGAGEKELRARRVALEGRLASMLASWAATPHPPGGIGFLHRATRREVLCTLIELVLRTEPEERAADEALDLVLRAQTTAALAAGWRCAGDLTAQRLRASFLDESQAVLLYLPGKSERGSHLFLLDSQGTRRLALPARDELRRTIGPFEEALAVPAAGLDAPGRAFLAARLDKTGREAARALLPDEARAFLESQRALTVVGAELLGSLPFEGLVLGDGRLLGQVAAVSSLPNLAVGLALAERPSAELAFDLGLVASLGLDARRARQPDVARAGIRALELENTHLDRLLSAARPEARWALVGPAADQAGILAAAPRLRATRVVNFLLHGVYLSDSERGSVLLLSGGDGDEASFLTADEVEARLALRGVVLLSACGTGLGPERLGDDNLANLGGAFLRAGAQAVVLSRAALELEATLDLMARVQADLLAAVSPAEALRRARAARAGSVDRLSAFADSGIQVVGLGQRPVGARLARSAGTDR